jgi:hypothetical protein
MKTEKQEKKPFVKTRTRMDNSIEVEFQKSPAKTLLGKILIWLVIAGTIVVPVASLIYTMWMASK